MSSRSGCRFWILSSSSGCKFWILSSSSAYSELAGNKPLNKQNQHCVSSSHNAYVVLGWRSFRLCITYMSRLHEARYWQKDMTLFMANKSSLLISLLIDIALEFILTILGAVNAPSNISGRLTGCWKRDLQSTRAMLHKKKQTKTTGSHFNQRGQNIRIMQITLIEEVFNQDPRFRKQRERM